MITRAIYDFPTRKATPEERKANRAAIAEIKTLFPDLPPRKLGDWLTACTAYPFNSVVGCMPQIRRLAKKAEGHWDRAIAISDMEMESIMKKASSSLSRAAVKQKKNNLRGK